MPQLPHMAIQTNWIQDIHNPSIATYGIDTYEQSSIVCITCSNTGICRVFLSVIYGGRKTCATHWKDGGMEIHMIWKYNRTHEYSFSMSTHSTWILIQHEYTIGHMNYQLSMRYTMTLVCVNKQVSLISTIYVNTTGLRAQAHDVNRTSNRNCPQVISIIRSIGYPLVDDQHHSMNHQPQLEYTATASHR